jgi:23S rRNA (cytosine1962-C5)-methyltransferase
MILTTTAEKDYELLDSGNGLKLERYGSFVLSRPDPQALWQPLLKNEWQSADAIFIRKGKHVEWKKKKTFPAAWPINFGGLTFEIRPSSLSLRTSKMPFEPGIKIDSTPIALLISAATRTASGS